MRSLIRARDESHRLSIQIALEANAVPFTTNAESVVSAGYYRPMDFYVVNDADYERAREIVLGLDDSGGPSTLGQGQRAMWVLFGGILLLIAMLVVIRGFAHR